MLVLPVAPYLPDLADFPAEGSARISNVLPRTKTSYGPFPGLTAQAAALDARCQGAIAVLDSDGNVHHFAGDASKLYHMAPGSETWTDVSKAGGYATGSRERWSFTVFGEVVIATNFTDAIQAFDLGSSSAFADLITSGTTGLRARYVAVVREWVVFANTFDPVDGNRPRRIWWTAIGDPTNVPTPGTAAAAAAQSDFTDVEGELGWCMGIAGGLGTSDGAIFFEKGVHRLVYEGPPVTFGIHQAENVRGTPAPGSLIQLGTQLFHLGEDGFYAFDGSRSAPLGAEKVDKTTLADLDQSTFHRVTSAVDPINKIVFWAYCGTGHDGDPNRILAYNWECDRWAVTDAGAIELEVLTQALSPGYSLEGLDTVSTNVDTGFSVTFDSRVWTGGRRLLACFDTAHRLNHFTGPNLAPTVDTGELQLVEGKRANVGAARPLTDAGAPTVAIGVRERTQDAVAWGPAVAMNAFGDCPQRASGRYHRARTELPAGTDFNHISGVELLDISPDGGR